MTRRNIYSGPYASNRALRRIGALLAGCLTQLAVVSGSAACDRAASPLEDPAIATAVADAVAVVEVDKLGGGLATAHVLASLKGAAKKGDTITIRGPLTPEEGMRRDNCGVAIAVVHKQYLVTLWNPPAGSTTYDLVEPVASLRDHSAAAQADIERAIASQHPHSAWQASKPGQPGLHTQLVLGADSRRRTGEVNLFVLVRNTGRGALEYTYKSWPEAEQSRCALRITDRSKQLVAAVNVPIPKPDIAAYFTKNSRVYKTKIEPGQSYVILLQRVTTAAQGWGYKEELGFRYYPIAKHGPHAVAAQCLNYFGPGSELTTAEVMVEL